MQASHTERSAPKNKQQCSSLVRESCRTCQTASHLSHSDGVRNLRALLERPMSRERRAVRLAAPVSRSAPKVPPAISSESYGQCTVVTRSLASQQGCTSGNTRPTFVGLISSCCLNALTPSAGQSNLVSHTSFTSLCVPRFPWLEYPSRMS